MPNDNNEFKVTLEAIKNATSCVAIASSVCGLPIKNSGDRCPSFLHSGSNPNSVVINNDYWYSFSSVRALSCEAEPVEKASFTILADSRRAAYSCLV